jgi:hypothetical protein
VTSAYGALTNGNDNYNTLIRMSRISKIYKLVRLMRLVKIFKVLKNKENLSAQFSQSLSITAGTERLIMSGLVFFFVCHVCACIFVLLG